MVHHMLLVWIISNSVNLPSTNLMKTKFSRIAIINKNIPNMVSQVTSVIGDMGFNIIEFICENLLLYILEHIYYYRMQFSLKCRILNEFYIL